VLEAVGRNGLALSSVATKLQADRGVVLQAVTQNGHALQYASPTLRADREVVLAAVAQHGHAFQHAPLEARANAGLVLKALARNGSAMQHASDSLRADVTEILLIYVKPHGPTGHSAPYILPPWGPLDKEEHRKVVLEALARKWKLPSPVGKGSTSRSRGSSPNASQGSGL